MWQIFGQLVWADLKAFKQNALSEVIDLLVWLVVVLTINVYLLPLFGVPTQYLMISFSGSLASSVSFRMFPGIYNLVNDINGDRQIAQKLILPIHPAFVFAAMILAFFISTLWVSIWSFPVSILIMRQLNPSFEILWGHFFAIWVVSALFFSTFSVWVASYVKGPQQMGKVFTRFVFPLWFFGGFQFTWHKLYGVSPWLAYLDLVNPYIYAMEGMRTAVLGPEGNLDFGLCIAMLLVLMLLTFTHAFRRFKKQLDFV
ncbi:MAG: ABC transporter permease [Myxococcota bacterium]